MSDEQPTQKKAADVQALEEMYKVLEPLADRSRERLLQSALYLLGSKVAVELRPDSPNHVFGRSF